MQPSDSEKVSINVGVVDLGQIDLLVEQGFYSNRTDFFRTASRNLLAVHAPVVQQHVASRVMVMGVFKYSASSLEKRRREGTMLDLKVVGVLVLGDDVTAELALATIKSVKVLGTFRAPAEVKKALETLMED